MVDYKELYLKMMQSTETAIQLLIQAQQECEELYISSSDAHIFSLVTDEDTKER